MTFQRISVEDALYGDVITLRGQAFEGYEPTELEREKDAECENYTLLNENGRLAAALRLHQDGAEYTIERLCSQKDVGVKGAGSILIQRVLDSVRARNERFTLETFCFVKLQRFWEQNGFRKCGETQLVNNEEKVLYRYEGE